MGVLTPPKTYVGLAAFQAVDAVACAARLTTAMLTLYFVLAVGAHVRVRDKVVNALPAAALLTTFAVMTVKGTESPQ